MDLLSGLLKESLGPWLKEHGYSRTGYRFVQGRSDNWSIIEFQKSARSTREQVLFTVNLGVVSTRIAQFGDASYNGGSTYPTWHWKQRIGIITPAKQDLWWSLVGSSDIEPVDAEVRQVLLAYGFPAIHSVSADEALRDLWLSGTSPGLSDFQRLLYLSVLLATIGPKAALDAVLTDLHDIPLSSPVGPAARKHLEMLARRLEH